MTNREVCAFLRERDDFVILTHRRPDGDTIGSAAALCRGLRALGKRAFVLQNRQFTPRYRPWLDGLICESAPEGSLLVAVDIAAPELLSFDAEAMAGRIALAIDHHPGSSLPCEKLTDGACAACAELIYALLCELGAPIDRLTAECLYLAISTDTGCFRYSNVTAQTLRTAASLVELGAQIAPINKLFFDTKSRSRLQLEARLTDSMELYADGLAAICVLRQSWLDELQITEDEIDSISGFPRSVEGVQIGVMLREVEGGKGKISLRTAPAYRADKLCAMLGGGGHAAAAGASVDGGIDAAKRAVLRILREQNIIKD